ALYKQGIIHHTSRSILRHCVHVCLPSMAIPPSERTGRDEGIIRLLLYLIRNVTVKSDVLDAGSETQYLTDRDAIIKAFHENGVFDLILTAASAVQEEFPAHDTIVLEIIYHLLKDIDLEDTLNIVEPGKSSNTLLLASLLHQEKALKSRNTHAQSTRHSRFGTTLWIEKEGN